MARLRCLRIARWMLLATAALAAVAISARLLLHRRTDAAETRSNRSDPATGKDSKFLKIIHLDLKGAPPRMSYLLSLLPMLKRAGGDGLLVEYEDAFPFAGTLKNVSSKSPYTIDEIGELLRAAEDLRMEIIPLVQTFGHLEYVLKLEEFRHLRESPSHPQEICPSKSEAVRVVKEMIRQVMAVHKNSRYVHIGCDEVQHMGTCPACSRIGARKTFSRHVYRMGSFVRATYPGVVPLIWDDMMRRWSIYDIQDSGLPSVVEPVVWVYGEEIARLVPNTVWYIYFKSFPRIWTASAFKGATGETAVIPDLSLHFENHLSWAKFIKEARHTFDKPVGVFGGIVLTGWSRYDHFAVLCELLPAGIPSLALNLILMNRNIDGNLADDSIVRRDPRVFRDWLDALRCPRTVPEANAISVRSRRYQSLLGECEFPGNYFYKLTFEYQALRERSSSMARTIDGSAWVSRYNVRKNFTSPSRVASVLTAEFEEDVFKTVGLLKSSLSEAMANYYEGFVVEEWMEQNVKPVEDRLLKMHTTLKDLLKRNVWPRRPLP